MTINPPSKATWAAVIAAAIAVILPGARAAILAPYQPDSATLHLWHMDAETAPVPDLAPSGGTNLTVLGGGATLGNASYPGLGTALSTLDGGQSGGNTAANIDAYLAPRTLANNANDNVDWSFADPVTGAFTFEALVRLDFDPLANFGTTVNGGTGRNSPLHIISGEQDGSGGGTRSWQFRLDPVGFNPNAAGFTSPLTQPALEFIGLGTPTFWAIVLLPIDGPDAVVSNGWYHVAVAYNGEAGAADNLKIYWTRVAENLTEASVLLSTSLPFDLPAGAVDFAIGNVGRTTPNGNFLGLIDEVRISSVDRGAAGMLFGTPEVVVLTQPADQTVAVGQPASFSIAVGGAPPFSYQWRVNGVDIPGATQSVYSIAAAQNSDAADYTVVVANSTSSLTSQVARLTVRTARDLTWVGFADWDTLNVNWDTDGDTVADAAYIEGDNVRFDGQGSTFLYVPATVRPSSVVVDSAVDYTLSTYTGGKIAGNASLTKRGPGVLTLELVNSYFGPTVIEAGVLQAGSSLGQGTIGTGPVTNHGGLVFGSSLGAVIDYITGTGGLTNNGTGNINFTGTNTLSGPLVLNAGSATISSEAARGNPPEIVLSASPNPYTTLNMGGASYPAEVPLALLGTSSSPDWRCAVNATSGTNVISGPITLGGSGSAQFSGVAGATWELNGPINGQDFTGILILRGGGTNTVNGKLQLGNRLGVTDSATWTIASTGNSWVRAEIASGRMCMGAAGALPANSELLVLGGTLDLAGYDQTVAFLGSTNTGSPFALNPAGVIASSSTTADSVFTLNTVSAENILAGVIRDSVAGGTRKVGLTLTGGGTLTLTNINTYSGDTTIAAGTLVLSNAASIGNSANLILGSGAILDASQRNDATLTLNAGQTLSGAGQLNLRGSLVNHGTIALKVNKSGSTLSSDSVQGLDAITYGGTLRLEVSGTGFTTSDTFKLFDAASYAGNFDAIIPAGPAFGLAWDTGTLAVDGILRVKAVATDPVDLVSAAAADNQLDLSWPADHIGWRLQVQVNEPGVGLSDHWVDVAGAAATNRVFQVIDPAAGSVFYRLVYP